MQVDEVPQPRHLFLYGKESNSISSHRKPHCVTSARNVNRLIGGVQFDPCGNLRDTTGYSPPGSRYCRATQTQGVEKSAPTCSAIKNDDGTAENWHSYVIR
jgi:hypothetical protein